MTEAISQIVKVQADGVVEVRSSSLHEGDRAQVTIVVLAPLDAAKDEDNGGQWRQFAGVFRYGNPHSAVRTRAAAR